MSDTISVADFGAVGNGVTDDWPAFNAALQSASLVVSFGGDTGYVGGEVVVPFRSAGYILGQTLEIPLGVSLRFLSGRQIIAKIHANDMYHLQDGAAIHGGDHRGGVTTPLAGHCFRLGSANSGQGRQSITNLRASIKWIDEVLYYEKNGGSQSTADNLILVSGSGKYAVKIEDGVVAEAVPRKLARIETEGTLGIDFGCSNDTFVSDSFLGGVRFTTESRGVHINGVRIANQATVEIRGHNHVLGGGWNPVPTFKAGTDSVAWNGYCNSGYPRDESGNARNSINFPETGIIPVLRSDATALNLTIAEGYPAGYREGWGIKRSGATYTFRLDARLNLTGGAATPTGLAFGFLYIDQPLGCLNSGVEQWVTGLFMEFTVGATNRKEPILGLVQPSGAGRIQLFDINRNAITGNQSPGGVATPGWLLTRLHGQIDYSPA